MKKDLAANSDRESREFHRIELELLALNLEFESARFPAAGSGVAAVSEEIREIIKGGQGDVPG